MNSNGTSEFMKLYEVAQVFQVNPKTVTRWVRTGKLHVRVQRTIGGHRRYVREDVEREVVRMSEDHRGG